MSPRDHDNNYGSIDKDPLTIENSVDDDDDDETNLRHARLQSHPTLWASIGVTHTLLTAGIIFGWASLLPILREEGVDYSPEQFATIFTCGAVGNYLSTLFFGLLLDKCGPRTTGIVASLLFGLGLCLASLIHSLYALGIGFALLGFAGPGIQMPTLHLANLFTKPGQVATESSGGGGALFMSAQAAAFDGGTAVFAILRVLFQAYGVSASVFLRCYLIVPLWVLLTSLLVWPDEILDNEVPPEGASETNSPYVGPGSPYLSPGRRKKRNSPKSLVNAPLNVVLKHPAFWSLAIWVSIHILKLNFIVATINDQLDNDYSEETAEGLIDVFGAMLPFGFVVLPIVATLLDKSALVALQLANGVGILYGAVLVFAPSAKWLQLGVVFPSVATSRQLVYSTIFHQIGQLFGFANYGTLLGITNLCVSSFSSVQTPLVQWSETVGSYTGANTVLLVATLPLLALVLWSDPATTASGIMGFSRTSPPRGSANKRPLPAGDANATESSHETDGLLALERRNSHAV